MPQKRQTLHVLYIVTKELCECDLVDLKLVISMLKRNNVLEGIPPLLKVRLKHWSIVINWSIVRDIFGLKIFIKIDVNNAILWMKSMTEFARALRGAELVWNGTFVCNRYCHPQKDDNIYCKPDRFAIDIVL